MQENAHTEPVLQRSSHSGKRKAGIGTHSAACKVTRKTVLEEDQRTSLPAATCVPVFRKIVRSDNGRLPFLPAGPDLT